jgi:hypothetical protein
MAWVSLGMSLGLRPRDIPRETHAIPRSDEKSTTLFLIIWFMHNIQFYYLGSADNTMFIDYYNIQAISTIPH